MPDPNLRAPNLRALTALRRLRHAETDAARRELGEAVARESTLAERHAALVGELDAARQISGDFDREAFVAWFGRVRTQKAQLVAVMRDAAAQTTAAQLTLAQRRVAETAAETALATAKAAQAAAVAQREQVTLEDVARALKRAAD
jgi:hypothetical protein